MQSNNFPPIVYSIVLVQYRNSSPDIMMNIMQAQVKILMLLDVNPGDEILKCLGSIINKFTQLPLIFLSLVTSHPRLSLMP